MSRCASYRTQQFDNPVDSAEYGQAQYARCALTYTFHSTRSANTADSVEPSEIGLPLYPLYHGADLDLADFTEPAFCSE